MTHDLTHPTILEAVAVADGWKNVRDQIVAEVQSKCKHPFIATLDHHGDMRLCLQCGKEEHAPHYHTFLFTLTGVLQTQMAFADYIAARVLVDHHKTQE